MSIKINKNVLGILPILLLSVLAISAILFVGCGGDDPSTAPGNSSGGDTTPPTVSTVTPGESSTGVSVGASITVSFSENIDPLTVTSSSVTVNSISGTVSVSGNVITFTPSTSFISSTQYTVTVASSVKDLAGNSLAADYIFNFTTAAIPVAVAGNDQLVSYGETVNLNGNQSSDPDGGTLTYFWRQVNGSLIGTLSGISPQFTAPSELTSLLIELTVSNGSETSNPDTIVVSILEDANNAIFVSTSGDDNNDGSQISPMATIQAAINKSNSEGNGADLYIAEGVYNETITLRTNVSLYGGFSATTWTRDIALYESKIMGGTYAVRGTNANLLTIDGMTIESANATTSGASSVGLSLSASQGLTITNNKIIAGSGYLGSNGSNASRPSKNSNGSGGSGAYFALICNGGGGGSGGSSSISRWGGSGGSSGGAGGGGNGGNGTGGDGISGGSRGSGGSFASNGGGGSVGGAGTEGANGAGGLEFGTVSSGTYFGAHGVSGSAGKHGAGGGGGGGGGAGAACSAGGGGGGAGGTRGSGGGRGIGGGASIGILVNEGVFATIENNIITTADGGSGGIGGIGAEGGSGGTGANGGGGNANGGAGGKGGNGGKGGWGGHGGGAGGGSTIGIVEVNSTTVRSNNFYTLGNPGVGGAGGQGGTRNDPNGIAGADGIKAEFKKITI